MPVTPYMEVVEVFNNGVKIYERELKGRAILKPVQGLDGVVKVYSDYRKEVFNETYICTLIVGGGTVIIRKRED